MFRARRTEIHARKVADGTIRERPRNEERAAYEQELVPTHAFAKAMWEATWPDSEVSSLLFSSY